MLHQSRDTKTVELRLARQPQQLFQMQAEAELAAHARFQPCACIGLADAGRPINIAQQLSGFLLRNPVAAHRHPQ